MIRTLYRRPDASTTPAAAFREVPATDPLEGAVPTWRIAVEDDPAWQATVEALRFDPTAVEVVVEVVDVSDSSRLDDEVDAPTRALQLVPALDPDDEVVVVGCPDCGATGTDPCLPKSNPAGKPLTRQHRRRRELLEREAGGAVEWLLLLVVVLVLVGAVVGTVGSRLPDLLRVECTAAEQAAGCGWHP